MSKFSSSLAALALAGLLAMAVPAQGAADAISLLLEKAEYWARRDRPDLAEEALNTVLATAPGNPDALARLAELEADRGNRAKADALLRELAAKSHDSQRVEQAANAVKTAGSRQSALIEARRLASSRDFAGAVAKYRESFGGTPPSGTLALEYYQTLAGTDAGWTEAQTALRKLAAAETADEATKLAYARVLTYREGTRREGIALLEKMSAQGPLNAEARRAWRDGLLWLNPGKADKPAYDTYLALAPGDEQVRARFNQSSRPAPTVGAARARGYAALERGDLAAAETNFNAALVENNADVEARAGIGLVRLKQSRFADAADLLSTAGKAAPAQAGKWQPALNSARFWQTMTGARQTMNAGNLTAAAEEARKAASMPGAEANAARLLLADIQNRSNDFPGAEASYRLVLASDPRNGDALTGLTSALIQQGREYDAEQMIAGLDPALRGRVSEYPRMKASMLRAQAAGLMKSGDAMGARSRFAEALALTPDDPWLRLDYSRLLLQHQEEGMAADIMAPTLQSGTPEGLHAAALFNSERDRWQEAADLLERIPAAEQTAEQRELLQKARLQDQIDAIRQMGLTLAEQREKMLALRGHATTPETRATLASAVADTGALPEALALLRPELQRPQTRPGTQMQYALLLLRAERRTEAIGIMRQLDTRSDLTPAERQALNGLRTALAVYDADTAREQENYADAYDAIAPLFREKPDDATVSQALARIYMSAGRPGEALSLFEGALRRDPENVDAARGAIDAAIAAGKTNRADALLSAVRRENPADPRLTLQQARLTRAEGAPRAALTTLDRAREQRLAELGTSAPDRAMRASGNPFRNRSTDVGDADAPDDKLLAAIEQEQQSIRTALAPQLVAEVDARYRSGERGMSRLSEGTMRGGFSLPLFGDDRLTATGTLVHVEAGSFDQDADAYRRFGSSMFQGEGSAIRPPKQTDDGVALNLAYSRKNFSIDIGSTPIGFLLSRPQGGIRWEPQLTDRFQLRVSAEQRPVTDSILSYAGAIDPVTGRKWGGVDSTGGSFGGVYDTGAIGLYADFSYADLSGTNVASNDKKEISLGGFLRLMKKADTEMTVGVNVTTLDYKRNLRYFSFGHGGYFSPQQFYSLTIPVEYSGKDGDLSYRLGAGVGVRHFKEDASPVFAGSREGQAALEALIPDRWNDPRFRTYYDAQTDTGIGYNLDASIDYRLSPGITLGGGVKVRRAADWTEGSAMIRLKSTFGD